MSAPRDLGPDFRSWLRDVPPMPPELSARTLSQTRQTRQRRRWLWFLPGPKPTAGADDQAERSRLTAPITTRPTGGIATMFSPTKLVSATAVAALAGVLLLAGPFTTQESVPPPAASSVESDTSGATLVRGELEMNRDYPGRSESLDWGYSLTDALNTIELTMSDERLSGRGRLRWNAHADDWTWVWTESVYLENEGGSWVGSGFGYMDPPSTGGELGAGNHERLVLEGQDGYAGLTAILDLDEKDSDSPTEVTGAIMAMTLPQTPGDAPTTFE